LKYRRKLFGECGRNLAGGHKRSKVLTKSQSGHFVILLVMLFSQANAQLRLNVILADLSATLVNNTVIKVNQDIDICFVSLHKETI